MGLFGVLGRLRWPSRAEGGAGWAAGALITWAAVVAWQVWHGNRHGFSDLAIYRSAVLWWTSGNHLYDYSQPDQTQGNLGFTYPPFAAILMVPLRFLAWPYLTQALYSLVTVILVGFIVWILSSALARERSVPAVPVFVIAFALVTMLEPIRETATFGQINFVLMALVLVDFLILRDCRRFFGVLTGLATAIKLVPGIFTVYLFVSQRWRAGLVSVASFVGACGLAAVLAPSASWDYWTRVLLAGEGIGQSAYAFNQSIAGVLARLAAPHDFSRVWWLIAVVVVAVAGLWRAARAAKAGDEVAGLSLAGLVGSLASPISWVHHLVWLVPALFVLVREGLKRRRWWMLGYALLTYLTVTFSLVAYYDESHPRPTGLVGFLAGNWDVLLMLGLILMLPYGEYHRRSSSRRSCSAAEVPSVTSIEAR